MDKLAKALEKARIQRNHALASAPPPKNYQDLPRIPAVNAVHISDHVMEHHRIVAHRTRSKEADTFRILRTQVLQAMAQGGMKTLGITSPNYGDGKTTIALNLALSIALDLNQTVLLVDLDLRKPNVMDYLGLIAPVGLTDYFTNDVPIADCLIRPSFERLSLLPAGRMLENSSEVLGSPKIAALAEELKTRYPDRLIIYDLPPVLAQDDPMVFLPHVDGLLLVVREGSTRTSDLKASLRALSSAHVIGTVLNHSHIPKRRGPTPFGNSAA
jgi:protein-tyrosine kinase